MPLLADYAITPDVFDVTSYSTEEVCGLHLRTIREAMMAEGLVRDLRAGEWRSLLTEHGRPWHRWAKEILKKLATQGRLIEFPPVLSAAPANDREWCAEALAAHEKRPMLGGVIATKNVKDRYPGERIVGRVDKLSVAPWWTSRSPSVRLNRNSAEYREQLEPILRCANSLQFIDPHLNPERPGYREFRELLAAVGRQKPLIELHRVCYSGSGRNREILDGAELEGLFRGPLSATLRAAGLKAEVFVWDNFHDRYLLSNLIGVSMQNGFDTTRKAVDRTTWSRLGRQEHDSVQREFDEASRSHKLKHRFTLP